MKNGESDSLPNFASDVLYPCKIISIYKSLEGKSSSDMKDKLIMVELDQFLPSIAKYIQPTGMSASTEQSFQEWLVTANMINQTIDVILYTLPAPRLNYY